jgi:hypothetical protein
VKKLTENLSLTTGASTPRMAIRRRTDPRRIPMNTLRFVSLGMSLVLCSQSSGSPQRWAAKPIFTATVGTTPMTRLRAARPKWQPSHVLSGLRLPLPRATAGTTPMTRLRAARPSYQWSRFLNCLCQPLPSARAVTTPMTRLPAPCSNYRSSRSRSGLRHPLPPATAGTTRMTRLQVAYLNSRWLPWPQM